MPNSLKKCSVCGEIKSLNEFYNKKDSKDGKSYRCKSCDNKAKQKWQQNNPERAKESAHFRNIKKRYVRNKYFSCCNIERCQDNPNCMLKKLKRAEQKLEKITEYCKSCNLKADFTACDILQIIKGKENE